MGGRVWVVIFAGDPLDFPRYRHTGVYIEFDGDIENDGSLFHIIGTHGFFEFGEVRKYNPTVTTSFRRKVKIGDLPKWATRAEVLYHLSCTRIRNTVEDADWNCQNWVGDALQSLVNRRWLSARERDLGLDEMVDVCLEAVDVEY